jgi:hypothetical protein
MVVNGVGGVLMKLMGCTRFFSGNSLGGVGRSFRDILDLRRVMVQRLVFSVMYDVGISPLR